MTYHNKLVRDRIPEICRTNGQTPEIRILSGEEYLEQLEAKLDEEVSEYHADRNPEELADILEVVYAFAEARGCSPARLDSLRAEKRTLRGGFREKIFLISTKETKEE